MGGCIEGWIVAYLSKGTWIKSWGQLSEEEKVEEEDVGRVKWEDISAAIDFAAGHNGDGGGGGPVEGRES